MVFPEPALLVRTLGSLGSLLEALSEMAAAQERWEFMLTIAPLPIPNGTGSPVNPIAMF